MVQIQNGATLAELSGELWKVVPEKISLNVLA
jgi:hypothetical protein